MLNIRSCYSIPSSVIKIEELAKKCLELGLSYISICDDNLFGLPELLKVAKKNHLKPVFGYKHTTENGVFSFFIKSKEGYFSLIQFVNEKFSLHQLLDKSELTVVFKGSKETWIELQENYPSVYYGIEDSEKEEMNDYKRVVYFKSINAISDSDFDALDLIKKIGRIPPEQSQESVSLETAPIYFLAKLPPPQTIIKLYSDLFFKMISLNFFK